ncbi:MAG: PAS domain S-box protein [Acidimicrobiales bacterium]
MTDAFPAQIRALQERVDQLSARVGEPGADLAAVAREAVADLATALEELVVTGEALADRTETVLAEGEHTELQRRYFEDLFEAGPAAYVITDSAGRITHANGPAVALLGVEDQFVRNKPLSVFLEPDSQRAMFRLLDRATRTPGDVVRDDLILRPRSGPPATLTAVVTQAPGAGSDVEYRWLLDRGIVGLPFDSLTPTEQMIASAALRLESIVESASDAIVAMDQQQRVVLFNTAATEMFGWSADEILGRPLTVLLPESGADHERLVEGFAEEAALSRRMGTRPTLQAARRNGESFAAEITVSKIRLDHHWVFTAIVRDVTEREQALKELEYAEEFNRRVVGMLDALVVVLDREGRIIVFNGACERATGFSFADVAGRHLDLLLPPEARQPVGRVFEDLLSGRRESTFENDWLTSTGGRRRIRWSNSLLLDESGEVTQVIGTGIDITHERDLEQQIIAAQRLEALGQLSGAIAHDFNNLLSIMQGHLELLMDLEGLPPGARDRTDSIATALKRGQALIANLTAIVRHEPQSSPVIRLNEATTALGRLLSDIVGPDISLLLELEASPDLVRIDPTQLEQVLLNLVLNACAAISDSGVVIIATRSGAGRDGATPGVHLTITDTGSGMEPATRGRAFEPFFTTKGPHAGTGLGLTSTKLIVEAAGGVVSAESESGVGTAISIWLPVVEAGTDHIERREPPADEVEQPELAGPPSGIATILVVDNEPELLDVVCDMLEAAGYRTLTATGASAAIDLVQERVTDIDLLLTDVVMPGQDGVALADVLQDHLPNLQVVFMTAHAGPDRSHEPGEPVRHLLHKPFSRNALLTEVRQALRG